jgi:chromosomal replication initiation ATPase DnaA
MNPTERRRICEHFKASYGIDVSHKDFDVINGMENENYIPPQTIIDAVCKVYKITEQQLRIKTNERPYVYAGATASFMLYYFSKLTLQSIARYLNRSNHATISNRIGIAKKLQRYNDFSVKFRKVQTVLNIDHEIIYIYLTSSK